jgi:hypothetical protein
MPPWKNRSIINMKNPITIPTANSTKIGATVTKLTIIEDGCVSGCFEGR